MQGSLDKNSEIKVPEVSHQPDGMSGIAAGDDDEREQNDDNNEDFNQQVYTLVDKLPSDMIDYGNNKAANRRHAEKVQLKSSLQLMVKQKEKIVFLDEKRLV